MRVFIIILWICSLFVALRMNYEATFLTWAEGPQMIGFSFVHTYGIPFILALLVLILVTFFWTINLVIKLIKKEEMGRKYIFGFIVSVFIIIINFIPYDISQSAMLHIKGLPKNSMSFFTSAAHDGNLGMMKLMMNKGYNPDSTIFTSCFYNACFQGHIDVMEFSLEHGANVNVQSGEYEITPLMIAAENDQVAAIEYLLSHGANPSFRDNFEEHRTALDYAIYYKHEKCIAILSKYK